VLDTYEDRVAHRISNYNWTHTISQTALTQRVRNAGYPNASSIVSIRVSQYSPTGNVVSAALRDSNGREYTFSRRAGLQAAFGAIRSQRFNIGNVTWQQGGGKVYANQPAREITTSQYHVITGTTGGATNTSTVSGTLVAIDGTGSAGAHRNVVAGGGSRPTSGNWTSPVNGNFILTGRGWGHSLGMSQWGAFSQAELGRTAEQIIRHYYTGAQVVRAS
jgi:stage II sporulation protein D